MADPQVFGGGFGAGWVDPDEEERRRRLDASPFGPGMNAPAALAGSGALAASGLPGGLWGPSQDYSGVAGSPRTSVPSAFTAPPAALDNILNVKAANPMPAGLPLTASQQAQIANEERGTALPPNSPAQGLVQTQTGTAVPNQWYSGWGTPVSGPGGRPIGAGLNPTNMPGFQGGAGSVPGGNDYMAAIDKIHQDAIANFPTQGNDANKLAAAKLGALHEQQITDAQKQIAEHKFAMEQSPAALRTKAYSNIFGAMMADGSDPQAAHEAAVKAALAFNPQFGGGVSGTGAVAGAPGAVGGPGIPPIETPSGQISNKDFFRQNLDLFTPDFHYTTPGDKMQYTGTAAEFGPKQAEQLVTRMQALPEKQMPEVFKKLMQTPIGPKVADVLAARYGGAFAGTLDPTQVPKGAGRILGLAPGVELGTGGDTRLERGMNLLSHDIPGTTPLERAASMVTLKPFGSPRVEQNRVISKTTGREVPLDTELARDPKKAKEVMENEARFRDMFMPYFAPQR